MTEHTILPLRCPSCGGAASQPSREMAFGAEFRCDHCGVTSVLIINRDLVPLGTLQKQGEKVCVTCGCVALRESRFCQQGHALVRRCVHCDREFPVEHQRCDFCGELQVKWTVKSPLVGTFCRAPSPGSPPFVEVGAHVREGQVLCIIKVRNMNLVEEIKCPCNGEVVAINADDGQEVMFGEGLFLIK